MGSLCGVLDMSKYHYCCLRKVDLLASKVKQVGEDWAANQPAFIGYGFIDATELVESDGDHPAIMKGWINICVEQEFMVDPGYQSTFFVRRNRLRFHIALLLAVAISKKYLLKVPHAKD